MTFLSVIRTGGYNQANVFTTITIYYLARVSIATAKQTLKVVLLKMLLKGSMLLKILLLEKNYNVTL